MLLRQFSTRALRIKASASISKAQLKPSRRRSLPYHVKLDRDNVSIYVRMRVSAVVSTIRALLERMTALRVGFSLANPVCGSAFTSYAQRLCVGHVCATKRN
jgi:hypothetical protein